MSMNGNAAQERGAALLLALLFMTLTFILTLTMLGTSGNEILIAGLHRDSVVAFERAQSGITEWEVRLSNGRDLTTSPSGTGYSVSFSRMLSGPGGGYYTLSSQGTQGKATRRIQEVILVQNRTTLGGAIGGATIVESGPGNSVLNAYSQTSYTFNASVSSGLQLAAWYFQDAVSGSICYTVAQCAAMGFGGSPMYPGTRRAASGLTFGCSTTVTGVAAEDPAQAIQTMPECGTAPDGLPWRRIHLASDPNRLALPASPVYFKTVDFSSWLALYYTWDYGSMKWVMGSALLNNITPPGDGSLAAIPPFPSTIGTNFDKIYTSGQTPTYGTSTSPQSTLLVGNWTLSGTVNGYGTLVVQGDLTVSGSFTFTGTVIVVGKFKALSGTITVTGSLLARDSLDTGPTAITLKGDATIAYVPFGQLYLIRQSWAER